MNDPRNQASQSQSAVTRFLRDQGGNSSLEFVVLFPFLLYLIFALAEVGTLMVRTVNLERAVDLAVREVRLGSATASDSDGLQTLVCNLAFLLGDCGDTLLLELRVLGPGSSVNQAVGPNTVTCVNRAEDFVPVVQFDVTSPSQIVLLRACIIVDPIFPTSGFLAELPSVVGGGYAVTATTAFVSEPS